MTSPIELKQLNEHRQICSKFCFRYRDADHDGFWYCDAPRNRHMVSYMVSEHIFYRECVFQGEVITLPPYIRDCLYEVEHLALSLR